MPKRAFDRVLVIMFENQYREYVLANPYFRWLARQGIGLAASFGLMHPSQANYIASIAGELCNVTSDDQPPPLPQRTIADLIEEAPGGISWKAYMDSYIPQNTPWSPALKPADQYPYVVKHNPFSSFAGILTNEARWSKIVNESQFFADVLNGCLPEYAWFTPNMWNDGHYTNGAHSEPAERAPALVDQAAQWLEGFFGALRFPGPASHLPRGTLVVVTFDESDFLAQFDEGMKYTYDGPNQIYTVLLGDMIRPGVEEEGYNHYSLLRTIEENFGLGSLDKNDAAANWFRFLWNEQFVWGSPEPTPIATQGPVAIASLQGLLYAVFAGESGGLQMRTFCGGNWSEAAGVNFPSGKDLAMAATGDRLFLVTQDGGGLPALLTYSSATGWRESPQRLAEEPATALALAAIANEDLLCVYTTAGGDVQSVRRTGGQWGPVIPTGHKCDGAIALGVLGPSVFLLGRQPGAATLQAISYNTASFNSVQVAESEYGGSCDDTTVDTWSPSAFPVAQFAATASGRTAGEKEPQLVSFQAGGRLAAGSLDGVLHLMHRGPDNSLLLEETFSIAGVMTAKLPVSYRASDGKTTSNGYGTLAEAGWSPQKPLNGAFLAEPGALACGRFEEQLILLFHSHSGGQLGLVRGQYEPRKKNNE